MKELVFQRMFMPAMDRFSTKVGFHDGEYHGTFEEHADRVLRLSHAMKNELGLDRSDRFAVMASNSHQFLELYHAGFLGAGVINPLNLRLAGKELQFILADSGTEVVFVDTAFAAHLDRAIAPVRDDLAIKKVVLIGDGDVPHDLQFEELVAAAKPAMPDEPEETDPAVLMYTGGTTGVPKGVLLDQRAELLNLYHIGMAMGLEDWRIYLHQTPMFHAASMGGIIGIPAIGGTSIFVPFFEPKAVMDLIEAYDVNWTMMVPTMIAMVLADPEFQSKRFESLQDLVYGASPMSAALLNRIRAALPNVNLWQGYGMTESSSVLTFLTDRDHRRDGALLRSAGRPVIGVEISIRDESGNELPPGMNGEVWARGGNFMMEYWNRPDETDKAFRDGWYHTGDEGHLDKDGYLYLVDRVKDMIVSGGENVYSIEVESALAGAPGVGEVAVLPVPDDMMGEKVGAVIVPAGDGLDVEAVVAYVRERIADFKVPQYVATRSEPLPRNPGGKVLKAQLRDETEWGAPLR